MQVNGKIQSALNAIRDLLTNQNSKVFCPWPQKYFFSRLFKLKRLRFRSQSKTENQNFSGKMLLSLFLITKALAQEDIGTVAAIEPTTEGPTTINPRINGFCWSCGVKNNVTVSFMQKCIGNEIDREPRTAEMRSCCVDLTVSKVFTKVLRILDLKTPLKICTIGVSKKVSNKTVWTNGMHVRLSRE